MRSTWVVGSVSLEHMTFSLRNRAANASRISREDLAEALVQR